MKIIVKLETVKGLGNRTISIQNITRYAVFYRLGCRATQMNSANVKLYDLHLREVSIVTHSSGTLKYDIVLVR